MLEKFLEIATAMSPLAVIALAMMIIFMLVKKETGESTHEPFSFFKRKKKEDCVPLEHKQKLDLALAHLEKIMGNHLHELPDMRRDISKMLDSQEKMLGKVSEQGERLARVEGVLKINIH